MADPRDIFGGPLGGGPLPVPAPIGPTLAIDPARLARLDGPAISDRTPPHFVQPPIVPAAPGRSVGEFLRRVSWDVTIGVIVAVIVGLILAWFLGRRAAG